MKKALVLFMVLVALLSYVIASAESNTGIWEKRYYVDEFDLPTNDSYISNDSPIVGKFSNSATTNSELLVYLFIDDTVSIRLIEYGDYIVKNSYSRTQYYDIAMMDTNENRYYFSGMMQSGTDVLTFSQEDSNTIISALSGKGTVRFAINEAKNPTTKYSFVIQETAGLDTFLPYSYVSVFSNGLACMQKISSARWGYIDILGNTVVSCEYDNAWAFTEGFAAVSKNGKWGFINTSGDIVIPIKYKSVGQFNDGLAKVSENGKFGFIDSSGNMVIPCKYKFAGNSFSEGLVAVSEGGKYGVIDTNGNMVIPFEYDYVGSFKEGLAAMSKNGKYGFIDANGNIVFHCDCNFVYQFKEGLASIQKNKKYGFIDTTGELIIPFEYDSVGEFKEGFSTAKQNGKFGIIDTVGNWVLPCEYEYIFLDENGLIRFNQNNKSGVMDTFGNILIPCEYDVINYGEGHYTLLKNNELTILHENAL